MSAACPDEGRVVQDFKIGHYSKFEDDSEILYIVYNNTKFGSLDKRAQFFDPPGPPTILILACKGMNGGT